MLVTFTQKVAELDLLLEPGDTVTLITTGCAPCRSTTFAIESSAGFEAVAARGIWTINHEAS
jgi:hypothetical protein